MEKIKEFLQHLKIHLKENKDSFVDVNEWCGCTESGFYTETVIDIDALWNEIDMFADSFKEKL